MKSILTSVFLCALCSVLNAAEPFIEKQDLFTAGEDPAYNIYHIPGIVVTARGSMLAWC
jgi:sialidase-1